MTSGRQAKGGHSSLEALKTAVWRFADGRCEAGFMVEVIFHLHLEGLDAVYKLERKQNGPL